MNLAEVITNSLARNEDLVLYAKKIDGRLLSQLETILLELTEEEHHLDKPKLQI
jgi:hypothetical protein